MFMHRVVRGVCTEKPVPQAGMDDGESWLEQQRLGVRGQRAHPVHA